MGFKVALCLSGQPRSIDKGFEYHKRNLLNHFDTDVFCHTWGDDVEIKNKIVNLYNPKKLSITVPYTDFQLQMVDDTYTRIPNQQFPARNTWQMFRSIGESMISWKFFNDYDVVVRSRYDYALNRLLPLGETKVGKVYVPSDRMTQNHDFCADMFAWGTPKVMDAYCSTFWNIDLHYHNGTTMIGEDMLSAQLKLHELVGENMVYVDMNNPFPPGKYNGNMHSIIRDDFQQWNNLRE